MEHEPSPYKGDVQKEVVMERLAHGVVYTENSVRDMKKEAAGDVEAPKLEEPEEGSERESQRTVKSRQSKSWGTSRTPSLDHESGEHELEDAGEGDPELELLKRTNTNFVGHLNFADHISSPKQSYITSD